MQVCYRGSGHSGGEKSAKCKNIENNLQELIKKTGDVDGCTAFPYGAVMVSKTGKDCRDQKRSLIMYKKTDKPIKILKIVTLLPPPTKNCNGRLCYFNRVAHF